MSLQASRNRVSYLGMGILTLSTVLPALISFAEPNNSRSVPGRPANSRPAKQTDAALHAGDVDLRKSRVYIHVGKTGLGHEHGVSGVLSAGHIALSGKGGGKLDFDLSRFDADSDDARRYVGLTGSTDESTRKQVTANMLGEQVLNVQKYPSATFEIQVVKALTELSARKLPQYELLGKFTLHGTTRHLKLIADAEESAGWTHLRGSFTILQSEYGITPFSKGLGVIGVADRLRIYGDLWISTSKTQD